MKLLIIRHANAKHKVPYATANQNDDLRPLTPKGRQRMIRIATGLHKLLPSIQLLATSQLVRAVQTAEILAKTFDNPTMVQVPVLNPGRGCREIEQWLTTRTDSVIAVVGHEPDLSQLIGWLITGTMPIEFLTIKKGAACLLECKAPFKAGACTITWFLTYKELRLLSN